MRVYFLSARTCALKVNGAFLGYTDGAARFLELSPRDRSFCELIPADGDFLPISFALCESVAAAPPRGVKLCFLPDGIALFADKFLCADAALRPIAAERLPFGSLTVFAQAGVRYAFEGEAGTKTGELGERFSACRISSFPHFALLEGRGALCALDETGAPFFCGRADKWTADPETGEVRVTAPLKDFCGRTAEYAFACRDGTPVPQGRTLSPERPLPERFALCRLLQALLSDETERAKELLTGDLAASLPALRDYFGNFAAVFPLPFAPFAAGTACPKQENVYVLKGYAATMREGKIGNIERTF